MTKTMVIGLVTLLFMGASILAQGANPQIQQCATGNVLITGNLAPANGEKWDIIDSSSNVIAKASAPAGWSVIDGGTEPRSFGVGVPAFVPVAAGYVVRYGGFTPTYSGPFDVIAGPAGGVPSAPTAFLSSDYLDSVTVQWDDNASNETGSKLFKKVDGGIHQQIKLTSNGHYYDDSDVKPGVKYWYKVCLASVNGDSAFSNECSVVLGAQGDKAAIISQGQTKTFPAYLTYDFKVKWNSDFDLSFYDGQRPSQEPTDGWAASYDGTSCTVSVPAQATVGCYNVIFSGTRLDNGAPVYQNGFFNVVPAGPTNLIARPGNAQVFLSWKVVSGATSYNVKRSTTNGGPYTQVGNFSGTSCTDHGLPGNAGLTNGTIYYYVVTAVSSVGESANSNQASARPTASRVPIGILPNPPQGFAPDALALPLWEDATIPKDSSDAPDGGPSSILGVNLAFGVLDSDAGADVVIGDPVVGSLSFGRQYRSVLAASNLSSVGLPAGWTHNWDYEIIPLQSGIWGPVQLVYPNGASETLTPPTTISGTSIAFTAPANAPYQVVGVPGPAMGQWASISLTHNGSAREVFTQDSGDSVYRLHTVVTETGSQINLAYSSGALTTISSSSSNSSYSNVKSISLSYAHGLLQSAAGTGGDPTVTYGYDSNGELSKVSNADNPSLTMWSYSYTSLGGMPYLSAVGTAGNGGGTATVTYDGASGRVASLVDAKGNTRNYAYDDAGGATVSIGNQTDQYKEVTDSLGRVVSSTDAAGNTSNFSWSGGGLISYTPPSGPGLTISRDGMGNPYKIVYPHGNWTTITWSYPSSQPFGQPTSVQEFGADGTSMPATTMQYFGASGNGGLAGYLSSITYPSGQTVSYTYTPLGDVLTITTQAADGSPTVVQYGYSQTGASGAVYEMFGKPYSVTDPLKMRTQYPYQLLPNLFDDHNFPVIDAMGNTANLALNSNGQASLLTLNGTKTVAFNYVAPGKATTSVTVSDSSTGATWSPFSTSFDSEFGVVQSADEKQILTPLVDSEFNLTGLTNGNGVSMHNFSLFPFTNSDSYTVGAGANAATWSTQYDANGNPSAFTGPGVTGTLARDSDGLLRDLNIASTTDSTTFNNHFDYDAFGRTAKTVSDSGVTHQYTYDNVGNLVQDSVSTGFSASYTYNPNGARSSMTLRSNSSSALGVIVNYTYNQPGNLTQILVQGVDHGVLGLARYGYDSLNRVVSVDTLDGSTVYQYDHEGHLASLGNYYGHFFLPDGTGAPASAFFNIAHDIKGNLSSLDFSVVDGYMNMQGTGSYVKHTGHSQYSFGGKNNSEAWILDGTNITLNYGLDNAENLTVVRGQGIGVDSSTDQITNSMYDSSGRQTLIRDLSASYDLAGNLKTIGNSLGTRQHMSYDAEGHRVTLDDGSQYGPQVFGYDGDQLVYRHDGGWSDPRSGVLGVITNGNDRFYIWGPTGPIIDVEWPYYTIQSGDGFASTFTYDPLGNMIGRSSGGGYEPPVLYDAYGSPIWKSQTAKKDVFWDYSPSPFGYKGQAGYVSDTASWSPPTNLIYCHNRYYDPATGRWISRDPIGLEGGENSYEYCGGDPVNNVDPDGLDFLGSVCSFEKGCWLGHYHFFQGLAAISGPGTLHRLVRDGPEILSHPFSYHKRYLQGIISGLTGTVDNLSGKNGIQGFADSGIQVIDGAIFGELGPTNAAKSAAITGSLKRIVRKELPGVELTNPQINAARRSPSLEKAYFGTQLDTAVKNAAGRSKILKLLGVKITPRFVEGPDFFHPGMGRWWDITTEAQWPAHVRKYGPNFGLGTILKY